MSGQIGGVDSDHLWDPDAFLTRPRSSRKERRAAGKALRKVVPLASHAEVPSEKGRPDPLALLQQQESTREPALVPLRYERMSASPFAFLRGSAIVMASDLSALPTSGISVQLCGDAHLSNFGLFASAERVLVFDLNDFDETLPGPFDWDLKRLAASFAVAADEFGFKRKDVRKAAVRAATSYSETMAAMSRMRTMDVWNARLDVDVLLRRLPASALRRATAKASEKSLRSTSDTALAKLTEVVDDERRFRHEPPILLPVADSEREAIIERLSVTYGDYLRTLPPDRIALLTQFAFRDIAFKVVGVGSVGTRALVLLFESGDGEPLILQAKQANASVLEAYLPPSQFDHHGKRVVIGQKVLQVTGDPFLGWTRGSDDGRGDYYLRQLKDMKGSIDPTKLDPEGLTGYAQLCGAVLARGHGRSGAAATISGYVGDGEDFSNAIGDFAVGYVDVNRHDYDALSRSRA